MSLRPADETSEDAVVLAAQRGDRRAFDALVHRHERALRGFLARRVGPAVVDDILQETWLAGWAALPRFTRKSRFKAWIFSIALHKVTDYHRQQGRRPPGVSMDEIDTGIAHGRDPYADFELRDTVGGLLQQLPPAQREVIELYYYAEMTLAEIAQALERNQNTVKYQFYRAHAHVAQGLSASWMLPQNGSLPPEKRSLAR